MSQPSMIPKASGNLRNAAVLPVWGGKLVLLDANG